jgi:hypothetical protein
MDVTGQYNPLSKGAGGRLHGLGAREAILHRAGPRPLNPGFAAALRDRGGAGVCVLLLMLLRAARVNVGAPVRLHSESNFALGAGEPRSEGPHTRDNADKM